MSFVRVCAKIFWRVIYCANPRPEPDSQSGFMSHRALCIRAPRIIWEYDLATAIATRTLTNPHTCEMVSSIFSAMSRLKFASTTRAPFPSIPSTEITNGEKCFPCSWKFLPCLSFFYFTHQSRSVKIGSFLLVSQSGSPSMTSIMASV